MAVGGRWCCSALYVFPEFFCIKDFSEGGICSSNFSVAWKKKKGYPTDVRKVSTLWCFVADFYVVVLFHGGISVYAHIVLSATLCHLLCIPFRDLRDDLHVYVWRICYCANNFVLLGCLGGSAIHILAIVAVPHCELLWHFSGACGDRSPPFSANYLHILWHVSR